LFTPPGAALSPDPPMSMPSTGRDRALPPRGRAPLVVTTALGVAVAVVAGLAVALAPGLVARFASDTSEIYKAINSRLPEAVGAIIGAVLLFLLPGNLKGEKAITWNEAVKIDWGVVLLYGGGFALGVAKLNMLNIAHAASFCSQRALHTDAHQRTGAQARFWDSGSSPM